MSYHHGNLREELLERAAEVIAEDGVEALSLRALARDLGVSHAAPRRHFDDRCALLVELAREGFRRSIDAMKRSAERAGTDPIARYRALGRAYVQFALDHPSYFRAINHPEVLAHSDAELAASKRQWFATLRDGAVAAQQAGWHPEADPDALVAFSCAGALGAATLLSDQGWREGLVGKDRGDIAQLADQVLDLIVHKSRTVPAEARKATRKKERVRRSA